MREKLQILLIRNGSTNQALNSCLGARCDDSLTEPEKLRIQQRETEGFYPAVERVYTSSLMRCRETAYLIYPKQLAIVATELPAYDYGEVSGCSYDEIVSNPDYRKILSDPNSVGLPGAENFYGYEVKSATGFQNIVEEVIHTGGSSVAIVTYRESISAIANRFCVPRSERQICTLLPGDFLELEYDLEKNIAVIKNFSKKVDKAEVI